MLNPNTLTDASKATLATINDLSGQTLDGVEKLVALNLQAARSLLADVNEGARAALGAKSAEELAALQAAALQSAPEKALAYGRQVREIFAAAGASQRAVAQAQAAELQTRFVESVDAAFEQVPGSEAARGAVKAAVAQVNSGVDAVSKAALQIEAAIDANIATLEKAAVTPVAKAPRAKAKA